jgi:hypothetical protein
MHTLSDHNVIPINIGRSRLTTLSGSTSPLGQNPVFGQTRKSHVRGPAAQSQNPKRSCAAAARDPIFAAITRHRATLKAYHDLAAACDDAEIDEPPELEEWGTLACEAAERELCSTDPSTLAGVIALIEYVVGDMAHFANERWWAAALVNAAVGLTRL